MIDWFKARWREVSTKFGLLVTAVATVAPQFAQFDPRIAYVGAAAGVVLILLKEQG